MSTLGTDPFLESVQVPNQNFQTFLKFVLKPTDQPNDLPTNQMDFVPPLQHMLEVRGIWLGPYENAWL